MWIGAAANYGGLKPDYVTIFDPIKTFQQKSEDLVSNLRDEKAR
jgi:hypothetical protein